MPIKVSTLQAQVYRCASGAYRRSLKPLSVASLATHQLVEARSWYRYRQTRLVGRTCIRGVILKLKFDNPCCERIEQPGIGIANKHHKITRAMMRLHTHSLMHP